MHLKEETTLKERITLSRKHLAASSVYHFASNVKVKIINTSYPITYNNIIKLDKLSITVSEQRNMIKNTEVQISRLSHDCPSDIGPKVCSLAVYGVRDRVVHSQHLHHLPSRRLKYRPVLETGRMIVRTSLIKILLRLA